MPAIQHRRSFRSRNNAKWRCPNLSRFDLEQTVIRSGADVVSARGNSALGMILLKSLKGSEKYVQC
jgi:hypothetical protein